MPHRTVETTIAQGGVRLLEQPVQAAEVPAAVRDRLGTLIEQALDAARLCSSDPLCADHDPRDRGDLFGAACHACLFASETSCERGNHYLDRALLVDTVTGAHTGFLHL